MSAPALWAAIAAMVPLMVLTAWWDLKHLKIPNWLVLAVLGVFVVTGLWGLPIESFLWRLVVGLLVLAFGFALFQIGAIGGGDAKMAAALVPFVGLGEVAVVLVIYALSTIVLLVALQLAARLFRNRETGWQALDQQNRPLGRRNFPMGLVFGATIVLHLGLLATDGP